jgi:hypothetical protein
MYLIGSFMIFMLVMIMLAPMATASVHLSLLAAAIDTNANATSNDTRIVSTDIASTIASWTSLNSSIAAAAGKTVTLMLSTPFDMTGFQSDSNIEMFTPKTAITIVGNAAVFDAGGKDCFFKVYPAVALVMSNVTLQNGNSGVGGAIFVTDGTITLSHCSFRKNTADYAGGAGGAISVQDGTITLSDCSFNGNTTSYCDGAGGAISVDGGTITLSDCSFNGNTAGYNACGGAIYVYGGGTITLSDCSFNGNTAPGDAGGALFFKDYSKGLLKNCPLRGTVSPKNNDIARQGTTDNVTFACADGEVGTPVQMSGTEITKILAPTCTTLYYCPSGAHACVPCDYIGCGGIKNLTECNQICI